MLTSRRAVLGAVPAMLAASRLPATEPPRDVTYLKDFDELWRTLDERYCYFGEKQVDWPRVRALYRPQAAAAGSADGFAALIERVLGELYDAHVHQSDPPADAMRLPYHDLWVEPTPGGALVTSVRDGSAAADAGVSPGEVILSVGGEPIGRAAAALMPRCLRRPDPAALAHALNVAASGRRGQPRAMVLRAATGATRSVTLGLKTLPTLPTVEARALPSGHGLIAVRSFADDAVVAAVDAALLRFHDSPGIIFDVRQNGGGDTAVARPIMGRFIATTKPYATMRRREGRHLSAAWTEVVEPRGPFTYTGPVAVLTSRWSASMAEGFPMGMRGIGRATIVGTPMMGLGAAVFPLRLDRTGVQLQYSAEPVYDVGGQPRARMRPDVLVESGGDVLAAAVAVLAKR